MSISIWKHGRLLTRFERLDVTLLAHLLNTRCLKKETWSGREKKIENVLIGFGSFSLTTTTAPYFSSAELKQDGTIRQVHACPLSSGLIGGFIPENEKGKQGAFQYNLHTRIYNAKDSRMHPRGAVFYID